MKSFDRGDYNDAGARLQQCIADWKPPLSAASLNHARHYIENDEYEMAYESLLLAAIEQNVVCPATIGRELLGLGLSLRLDVESIFDPDFWKRALDYLAPALQLPSLPAE